MLKQPRGTASRIGFGSSKPIGDDNSRIGLVRAKASCASGVFNVAGVSTKDRAFPLPAPPACPAIQVRGVQPGFGARV